MNRELRRLQEREEKRQQKQRAKGVPQRRPKRDRASFMQFLREVRQELRRVAWPSRQELMTFTLVTVITTGVLTALIFGMDFTFKKAVLIALGRF